MAIYILDGSLTSHKIMQNITTLIEHDADIKKVQFHALAEKVFSSFKLWTVIGIWESKPLDGGETLLAWKQILLSCTKPENSDIYLFVSNSDTTSEEDAWIGPYRNDQTDIISLTKRYLKVRAVLIQRGVPQQDYGYNGNVIGPSIESIFVQCVISGTASKFYTSVIDLGFSPRYILITSESDIPDGAVVRFGVSSLDTIDSEKYQFISENKIVKLNKIPVTGQKMKLFIEMSGNSGDPITIHEFAVMFSGDEQIFINKIHDLPNLNYEYSECPPP